MVFLIFIGFMLFSILQLVVNVLICDIDWFVCSLKVFLSLYVHHFQFEDSQFQFCI